MLGPVDAAADEDAPLAVEYGHADAGTIGEGFETGHALGSLSFRHGARHARASAGIAAVAARGESMAEKSIGVARRPRRIGVGYRPASSAPRTSDSAGKPSSSGCRG